MYRFAGLALAFTVLIALPVAAAEFTDAQKNDLKRVTAYLQNTKSVKGRFTQISPTGAADEGTFYWRKPGRLRFEYNKPNPTLIVSDGTTVAVSNSALKTTDRYPLLDSPLDILASDTIDLTTDKRVTKVTEEPGAFSVTARQDTGPAQGTIILTFAEQGPGIELRQWEIIDAQGLHTTVVVSDLQIGVDLSPRLFVIEELSPFGNRSN